MRWMVILCAAAPLAYGAEPSAEPAPDPDAVTEEEARLFKSLGYRQQKDQGEMKWCRREGDAIPGSRLKPKVCRTADQVRALGET